MLMHAKPVHKVIMGAIPWAKPNAKVVPVVHIPIMLVPVVTMVRLVQVLVVPRPVWIVARANIRVQTVVPARRFAYHAVQAHSIRIQERGMSVCAANVNLVGSVVPKHVQHRAPDAIEVHLKARHVQIHLVQLAQAGGFKH